MGFIGTVGRWSEAVPRCVPRQGVAGAGSTNTGWAPGYVCAWGWVAMYRDRTTRIEICTGVVLSRVLDITHLKLLPHDSKSFVSTSLPSPAPISDPIRQWAPWQRGAAPAGGAARPRRGAGVSRASAASPQQDASRHVGEAGRGGGDRGSVQRRGEAKLRRLAWRTGGAARQGSGRRS
jgi:hypothetical protein